MFFIPDPKHGTRPATRKISSIPAETRTVALIYSFPYGFSTTDGQTLGRGRGQ